MIKVLIIRYPLHYLTRNKSLSSIIGVITLVAVVLLIFGYMHAGVYAVKIFGNRTGIWFDSQQPLVPQMESGMLLQKKNMSETEFKRTMENLSDASAKMVASCSGPFSELLSGLCDFSISTISVICKTEIAKQEIFECTNPGIDQYLRTQEITDPEPISVIGSRRHIEERFQICLRVHCLITAQVNM